MCQMVHSLYKEYELKFKKETFFQIVGFVYIGEFMNRVKLSMKRIRLEIRLTKEQFAKAFNVPITTVENWEVGIENPDNETLIILETLIESITKYN